MSKEHCHFEPGFIGREIHIISANKKQISLFVRNDSMVLKVAP
jgi:hypothetical protein